MAHSSPVLPAQRVNRQAVIARNRALAGPSTLHLRNIEAVLATATESEWQDGLAWYPAAHDIAATVGGNLFGRDKLATVRGAAIIAALSPQVSWEVNVVRALAFGRGEPIAGFGDGIRKAEAIRDGANPALVLGGRKVRSFWHNIIGNHAAVTVDRHALAIAAGTVKADERVLQRIGGYATVAGAYRTVARREGLAPAELQAITWLAWRREHAWER